MASFREFLEDLQREGELKVMDEEVDWNLEASAICAMSQRVGGPAIQFNKVKGYPGARLVGSLFAGPGFMYWPQQKRLMHGRIALGMGLSKQIHYEELQETIIERKKAPIRALQVESGPCQEVVIDYKDVDLYSYPIPYLHDREGGRYLTSHVVLTKDPELGWTNFGVYRLMLGGRNMLVHGSIPRLLRPRHVEEMVRKAARRNEPLPFAIVIGAPPPMLMAGCVNLPSQGDEYAVSGALAASPLVLVKAKLSDILVPADAEIVLEGHIYPGEMMEEGPFASMAFYSPKISSFVYRVELITQRKDPIVPFVAEGAKPSDSMCLLSMFHGAELVEACRMMVYGAIIHWITIPVEAKLTLAVVGLGKQRYPGFPARIGRAIYTVSPFVRKVLVVDADVDAQELSMAINDSTQKVPFDKNIFISHAIDQPVGLTENHGFATGLTSNWTTDATWRLDKPDETKAVRITFETCIPEAVQKRVLELWKKLGVKPDPVAIKRRPA